MTLGLQFRLVRFDPAQIAGPNAGAEIAALALASGVPARSRLRNLVAHLGLGTAARAGFPFDPFGGATAWGSWELEDTLLAGAMPPLSGCELPLAVLRLRGGQIDFIDMWTARRGLRSQAVEAAWPLVDASARKATDAATFFQFQEHLAWLFANVAEPGALVASSHFRTLPPVGFLPLQNAASFLPTAGAPVQIDPDRVLPRVEEALPYPAVTLSATEESQFTLYQVGDAPGWLLFVSNAVPSPEREAIKCAELEDRISILEDTLAAPGVVTGAVTITYTFGASQTTAPVPGISVQATLQGDTTATPVVVITDAEGGYAMTLPPGTYTLSITDSTIQTLGLSRSIEVASGASLNENFDIGGPIFQLFQPT